MEPDRVEYSPIIDRPVIRWPNDARVAFWLAPNIEFYEYLPPANPVRDPWPRSPHPDVLSYAQRDYGNRVGFWRLLEVTSKHGIRCTASLNEAVLEHFPEIRDAMVKADWAYMSHGIYNTRYLAGISVEEERAFYRDIIETLRRHTGKQLKGMLAPFLVNSENTPDLMAEAGLIYHVDWFHDDQPFPLKVKRGKLISLPYNIELNDTAGVGSTGQDAAYFAQIIKDQFDVLYEEGAESGRVMAVAVHPYWIGHPHRIKYLDEALTYILSHDGVWCTTADEIADYYIAHYYDQVLAFLEQRRQRPKAR